MGQVRQYPSETAFAPLVDGKDYTISLSSYIFYGGDGYDMLASGVRCISTTCLHPASGAFGSHTHTHACAH